MTVRDSVNSLKFNHVIIVESLRPYDEKTGTQLHKFISELPSVRALKMPVSLEQITSSTHFHHLIRGMVKSAREDGLLPVLHVECHGDDEELQFTDGSTMSYVQLSRLLLQLNRATNLNVVAGFAACSGGFFLREMNLLRRCPVRLMVGPSDEIDYPTLLQGFKVFYQTMFDTVSIADAEMRLKAVPLHLGTWIVQTAEGWYFKVARAHLIQQCSKVALKERAAEIHRKKLLLPGGSGWSVQETYRRMTVHTRIMLLDKYFRRFFMVNAVPSNEKRFEAAKLGVAHLMLKLRRKGTHAV